MANFKQACRKIKIHERYDSSLKIIFTAKINVQPTNCRWKKFSFLRKIDLKMWCKAQIFSPHQATGKVGWTHYDGKTWVASKSSNFLDQDTQSWGKFMNLSKYSGHWIIYVMYQIYLSLSKVWSLNSEISFWSQTVPILLL